MLYRYWSVQWRIIMRVHLETWNNKWLFQIVGRVPVVYEEQNIILSGYANSDLEVFNKLRWSSSEPMEEKLLSLERKSSTLSVWLTSSGICLLDVWWSAGNSGADMEYTEAKIIYNILRQRVLTYPWKVMNHFSISCPKGASARFVNFILTHIRTKCFRILS